MPAETGLLLKLAQLYGVQSAYYGSDHRRKSAPTESILAILKLLGAPISSGKDLQPAYQSRSEWLYQKIVEPVTVAWNADFNYLSLCLPEKIYEKRCNTHLILEDGRILTNQFSLRDIPVNKLIENNGVKYYQKALSFETKLPYGYHQLKIEVGNNQADTLVLSAPLKAYTPEDDERSWGIFIPLYALHSNQSWGAGNFSDLETLSEWAGNSGGKLVASLPLLPAFLEKPYEPSPYLPISKLFWNEFYIDMTRVPELQSSSEAQQLIASSSFQKSIRALRMSPLIEYKRIMAHKRIVLEKVCRIFFSNESTRRRNFNQYLARHAELEQYACFRAATEKQDSTWRHWQNQMKPDNLHSSDYDEETKLYHLYVQWLAQEQLQALTKQASTKGTGLYLDLPLGTHPDGFDTWRFQDIFVNGISAGAPPDKVFTRGQNWNFPPLHPDKIRETRYAYVIAYLRHHLQCAKTLRIDHIMGLHRLFFIPSGLKSGQGTYVRYHPGEMYAILAIESHRYQSIIVGEDLGIVPRSVRKAMNSHNIQGMWVMHYELAGNEKTILSSPKAHSVASLNTHDMPPFASLWRGQDIIDRLTTGIITQKKARKEQNTRKVVKQRLVKFLRERGHVKGRNTTASVLKGCLDYLATSRARIMLINLEDLWLETRTQNIPSTTTEHPNWRQKARFSLDILCQIQQIMTILGDINRLRSGRGKQNAT